MSGLRLVFVDGRSARWEPCADVARGGITTALLALTRELASRGHRVHVVSERTSALELDGVGFRPRRPLGAVVGDGVDALVAIPDLLPLALPVPARARVAWTGNAFATGDCLVTAPWVWAPELGKPGQVARLLGPGALGDDLSAVVVKSQWQAAVLAPASGLAPSAFRVIGNGVPLEHYPAPAPFRRRLVYTSQPRRGLDLLLGMLPAVRAQVPDVAVDVYGYDSPDDAVAARARALGVQLHGALGKAELAAELSRGGLLAYPNTLRETFCSSVAEAQAAGLPVVTSDRAALAERVRDGHDGVLVGGEPTSPEYAAAFVAATVRLLQDPALSLRYGAAARERALAEYSWHRLATRWEELLGSLADRPLSTPSPAALHVGDDQVLSDRGRSAVVPAAVARRLVAEAAERYGVPTTIPTC